MYFVMTLLGFVFQPLARLGAQVTGIDASAELIEIAKWHAALDSNVENQVTYKTSTIEDLCNSNAANDCVQLYDGVVASEIVEHVSDAKMFVDVCCSLVKVIFLISCNTVEGCIGVAAN